MKDLVTKGTGNSRYMKSAIGASETWEQAREKLRNGMFPFDLNGLNEAGIEQMGMALSKQNLLSDETAAALGLSGDPTVDDAFGALDQSIKDQTKIGDVKITTRTDLGDKWLLCNGERIDGQNYSDLAQTIQNPLKDMNAELFQYSDYEMYGSGVTGPISNGNGEFVCIHCSARKIIYSQNNGQSWNVKSISGMSSTSQLDGVNAGIYANGKYVFAYSSSDGDLYICYADDPAGNFSFSIVSDGGNSSTQVQGIAYGNGYWCILTRLTTNNTIDVFTATSLEGPWTKHAQIGPSPCAYATKLLFEDGKFSFASTGNGTLGPSIFSAEDPSGEWNQHVLDSTTSSVDVYGYGKTNGYYYAYFKNKGLYYAKNIDDNFELVSLSDASITYTSSYKFPFFIVYGSGRFYSIFRTSDTDYFDEVTICESLNIYGPYTDITAMKFDSKVERQFSRNVIFVDGTWCVLTCGNFGNSSFSLAIGAGGILPSIPVENAYAYIKAKE